MNKKALYGLLIAILIPLAGYLYVKTFSDRAVVMPRHYLPDSIVTATKNGKEITDTIWHQLPDFRLTNQLGKAVSWNDIRGRIVVSDFFFTHCPSICPNMTRSMKLLQDVIKSPAKVGDRDPDFVQFLSFSIDPGRDSVEALKRWNDRFQINPEQWWLLTGDKKTIYDMSLKEMKLALVDGKNVDTGFYHSDMFVLVDTNRYVRGYYHVLKDDLSIDTATVTKLAEDIILLSLEKSPGGASPLAGKLELIAIVFVVAGIILVVFFTMIKKEKSG